MTSAGGHDCLVLGGGSAGLMAAHRALDRGAGVVLIEGEVVFGGLAGGRQLGGNWYDLGVHMLHAHDPEMFGICAAAMGGERVEAELEAHIHWLGRRFRYPLRGRDMLRGIPPHRLAWCVAGLLAAGVRGRLPRVPEPENAEQALIAMYGRPLYRLFFEDFTHRYWGIHPRGLAAEFIRRKMPRLSAVDVIANALEALGLARRPPAVEGALRFETLHYSRTGAEALPRLLAEGLRRRGASLHTGERVVRIEHGNGRVRRVATAGRVLEVGDGVVISTIPLRDLIGALNPAPPPGVLVAARALRYKPMVVYGLRVGRTRCLGALYTYFRERVFHRVGEPKNAGLRVNPEDHTILIVELMCELGDARWRGEALEEILADLEAEGICKPGEVVESQVIPVRHAYPVFEKGFEAHLETVREYLSTLGNLRSTGRQGAFTYPNMHAAMRMGADAVDELIG